MGRKTCTGTVATSVKDAKEAKEAAPKEAAPKDVCRPDNTDAAACSPDDAKDDEEDDEEEEPPPMASPRTYTTVTVSPGQYNDTLG